MKKLILTASLFIFSQCTASAATTSSLTINNYYAATCEAYSGTWQGYITDPSDLFGNGGPWPVKAQFTATKHQLTGKVSAIHDTQGNVVIPARSVYAQCSNGKLTNLFWGELGQCGSLSQQGILVSKNTLLLQLNYENSMNGATLTTFLTRQSDTPRGTEASTSPVFKPEKVVSCH